MRKNSIKNTRINMEVQKELANIIRGGIKDPRISPLTTVVAVEVAPDLKTAKAYISVLGDEEAQKNTLAGFKSAITIDNGAKKADAKRIMAVMSMGIKQGQEITVTVEGEDEEINQKVKE